MQHMHCDKRVQSTAMTRTKWVPRRAHCICAGQCQVRRTVPMPPLPVRDIDTWNCSQQSLSCQQSAVSFTLALPAVDGASYLISRAAQRTPTKAGTASGSRDDLVCRSCQSFQGATNGGAATSGSGTPQPAAARTPGRAASSAICSPSSIEYPPGVSSAPRASTARTAHCRATRVSCRAAATVQTQHQAIQPAADVRQRASSC